MRKIYDVGLCHSVRQYELFAKVVELSCLGILVFVKSSYKVENCQ
jgi:hypothetical protein